MVRNDLSLQKPAFSFLRSSKVTVLPLFQENTGVRPFIASAKLQRKVPKKSPTHMVRIGGVV